MSGLNSSRARRLARVAITAGERNGLTFRAIGGAAVMLLYDPGAGNPIFRTVTHDVDLLGDYEQQVYWQPLFARLGFSLARKSPTLRTAQYEFTGQFDGEECQLHVFASPLSGTELVPPPYFTNEWKETVPPSALLLSKILIKREQDRASQLADIRALLHAAAEGSAPLDTEYLRLALKRGVHGWRRWLFAKEAFQCIMSDECLPYLSEDDRSYVAGLWSLLDRADGDWLWQSARWVYSHGLPGPVYMRDYVEALPE